MQLALVLFDALAFGVLFGIPGLLLTSWLLPEHTEDDAAVFERTLVALAAGFGGVSVLAFSFSLLTLTHLGWIHLTLAAGFLAGLARRRLRRSGKPGSVFGALSSLRKVTEAKLGLALVLLVFGVFLVNYDRAHFQYGCIHTVVQLAINNEVEIGSSFTDAGTPQERLREGRRRVDPNPIRGEREVPPKWMNPLVMIGDTGQRYGTTAMIAPAAVAHGFFGFRLVYALHAALLAGFLFLIGRRLTASDRLAALAAGLALLNPWLLKVSLLDENMMSAAWAAGAICLATRSRPAALLAGLFCGLAIGIRHIDIGLAAGIAIVLWASSRGADRGLSGVWREALKPLALGLLWALFHELVHHQVAYGSVFSHEHFVDEVWFRTDYQFFGVDFQYAGLLNWPFADEVVRTPYNGFPTFLLIPLSVLAHLGSILVALTLIGLAVMARVRPLLALALGLWALPIVAMHLVLEDWLDPNKMGIPLTLLPIVGLGLVVGLQRSLGRRSVALGALGLALLLSFLAHSARTIAVDDDPAFYLKYPLVRTEEPIYAEEDRMRWTRGNLFPDWSWMTQHSAFIPGARFQALWQELGNRDLRQGPLPPQKVEQNRGAQTVRLDLSRPLVGRRDFFAPATSGSVDALDLRTPGATFVIEDLELGWADRPAALRIVHDSGSRIRVFIRFGIEDFADFESVSGFTIDAQERRGATHLSGAGTSSLSLLLPSPAILEVAETVSLDQVLIYRWDGSAVDGEVELSDWRKLFHN
jgi:hypothetical protein